MKLFTPVFAFLAAALLAALCFSCTTPERQAAVQRIAEDTTAATADGIVTQAEYDALVAQVKALKELPSGTDWSALGGTALATIIATLTGIRIMPNSVTMGAQEAAALARLAGIKPS